MCPQIKKKRTHTHTLAGREGEWEEDDNVVER